MEDLISRKAAVEAIEKTDWYHINKDGVLVRGANSAEDLPLFIAEDVFEALRVVAPAKQQWIPVTERLPERGHLVLCIGKKGGMFLASGMTLFPDGSCWCSVPNARNGRNATHWMPLPEPPKEVQ